MRRLTAVFAITVIVLAAVSGAEEKSAKEKLMFLLSDRHYHPSEKEVKDLGPAVTSALREIAMDESELIFRRVRAVYALGYFDDDDTSLFLQNAASVRGQLPAVRWSAIRSLARSRGDDAVGFISGYLKDDNRFTRRVAGISLKKIGTPRALLRLDEARREGYLSDIKP